MAEEKRFETKIKKFLASQNCWVLKTWGGGVQRSGVPDLLVCCNGIFLGIEVKAAKGKPTPLQVWNIDKINEVGGIAMVLYPEDYSCFKELIHRIMAFDTRDNLQLIGADWEGCLDAIQPQ